MAAPVYDPDDSDSKKAAKKSTGSGTTKKSGSTTTKKSSSGGGSSSSSSSGGYDYGKEQKKAQRKASERYIKQAESMAGQIKALKYSLGQKGFKAALSQRLANIGLVLQQQDAAVMEGYNSRVGDLKGAAADNDKSASDQSFANLSNRGRERANALSEAMLQGAGESDVLRSQMMSLRNWDQNQNEINRSFFDTLRSVNSSLGDLNVDTKTARLNLETQANADRDAATTEYFNQRSQGFTQLGNLRGQQAEYYGMANEQVSSKSSRSKQKQATAASDRAFMRAAKQTGKTFKNPGNSRVLREWKGAADIEGSLNNTASQSVATATTIKRPEGAQLRKW